MSRKECIINSLFVVIAIFVVFLLDSCSGGKQHIDEYADIPNFKKVFARKTIAIEGAFVKDDNDSVFTYSSMEEAEWKLVHYFFPDGKGTREKELYYFDFDYDLFEKVVMSDTSSIIC